jgi:3-oxoacyl-[acyl-carrier protein] reductase
MSNARKTVIVSGGSRGLGLAIVRDLLAQNYRLATCSRKSTKEVEDLSAELAKEPGRFLWQVCEMGDEKAETNFFEQVLAWAGEDGLYGLVNNAAIAGEGILATFPTVDAERILGVNLISALRMCRLALRSMLAQGRPARVINISSIVGLRGYTGLAAYSASKAGLDGMTRSLAREVGRRAITVNSVAPGYLMTELSASLGSDQRRQIINRTPLGRLGEVADVVPAIRFLLSEEAGFVTGQTLVVDGGITC